MFLLIFLVNFAESSFINEQNEGEIHLNSNTSSQILHEISQKILDIQIHGILLWASMGFLMPVGILAMRMSSCTKDLHPSRHRILFYIHASSQVLSCYLLRLEQFYPFENLKNAFENCHQRIGLALYGAIYLQVVIGFRRPKRGTRFRRTWYFAHWLLGTSMCLVGILNIYTGVQAYHKRTSKSTTLWTIVFTAQVSFMVIFYLFQDKWDYILKRGVMIAPDNNPNSSAAQLESQTKDEPSRKSNALGTYFSRTNALNKLFQLT